MPLMPNAYVTSAKFTGGKIELTVVVDDFKSGGYVEISGQAAQANGAFANFYSIQEVPSDTNLPPDPGTPGDTRHYGVFVSASPVPGKKFRKNLDVTTIMRVARVWLTVLDKNQASGPAVQGTTWDKVKKVSEVGGPW
jgi:hypothetical protein